MADGETHPLQMTPRALDVLASVARHLSDASDLEGFFGHLSATIGQLVRAGKVAFWLWDGKETIRIQPDAFGLDPTAVAALGAGVPCSVAGTDLVEQVVFGGRRIRLADDEPALAPYRPLVQLIGFSDLISVAWKTGDTPLGLVAAYDSTQAGGFTEDDLEILELAASAAGLVWLERMARDEIAKVSERENARLRQMVSELEKTERKLNEAQEITHIGSWEWDIPNDKITWSPELHRIFGIREDEFDGTFAQYQGLIHPDDQERTRGIVQAALERVEPFAFEHRIIRADGSLRTIDSLGNVEADATGKAIRMMGTAHDISDARAAEQLRVRQLTLLLDAAQTLAASTSEAEILTRAGTAAAELLSLHDAGKRRQVAFHVIRGGEVSVLNASGEGGAEGSPAGYPLEQAPILSRVLAHGRPQILSPDEASSTPDPLFGPPGWVSALAVPLVARRSRAVLIATSRERHFQGDEADLVEVLAHIARLAISNVENLSEERANRTRLEELERVKSEFLRLASHELRGPLAIARGYTSMILDGTFGTTTDPQHSKALPMIDAKLAEIHDLVEQMLDAARLEDDRLHLEFVEADLTELVREAVVAAQQPPSELHRVVEHYPAGAVPVRVDAARMRTVVMNLVGNAIKYSPGGGSVQVRVAPTDEGRVVVEVADEGVGIAEDDMARLFTRFGRIVTLDNSHIPGSGLGLYLSRNIAIRHGGNIVASSVEGKGSVFTLSLPLAART